MNLKEYDLTKLAILWDASEHNLDLRNLIEKELKQRIQNNENFSREYLFKICKIEEHAITISFIPTTEAYKKYGPHITIDIILEEEEKNEISQNYNSEPSTNSYGRMKAKALVTNDMSEKQIKDLRNKGFHTNEILEVLHL